MAWLVAPLRDPSGCLGRGVSNYQRREMSLPRGHGIPTDGPKVMVCQQRQTTGQASVENGTDGRHFVVSGFSTGMRVRCSNATHAGLCRGSLASRPRGHCLSRARGCCRQASAGNPFRTGGEPRPVGSQTSLTRGRICHGPVIVRMWMRGIELLAGGQCSSV